MAEHAGGGFQEDAIIKKALIKHFGSVPSNDEIKAHGTMVQYSGDTKKYFEYKGKVIAVIDEAKSTSKRDGESFYLGFELPYKIL